MQDLKLSSKWSVTLHDPESHLPCCIFGQFETLLGFWQIFNSMVAKNIFHALPLGVNITIYRENVHSRPNTLKQWHGEWNIELKHQANPIKIYQKMILLIVAEELTSKVTGMVLKREGDGGANESDAFDAKISIFTDTDNAQLDVKNVLLSNSVIDINLCVDRLVVFHPFRLLHIPVDSLKELEQPVQLTTTKKETLPKECAPEEMKAEMTTDTDVGAVPCVKYSLQSLLEYSALIQRQTQAQLAPSQRFCDLDCIRKVFGKHLNAYHLKLLDQDAMAAEGLTDVLAAEGCAVCLQTTVQSPYHAGPDAAGKDACHNIKIGCEQKDSELDDTSKSPPFIVAKCPELHCQHVIHSQCMLDANDTILMRGKHCPFFFKTIDLSTLSNKAIQKEIGYHIDMQHTTGRKYHFSLRINHLISNQTSVSPQWPITVPSYLQLCDGGKGRRQECLQIFFENTELQISRGTIQVAVVADHAMATATNSCENPDVDGGGASNIFLHNANFEIPTQPPRAKQKRSHKIYQLQYADPVSHNALIINVNIQWEPKLTLQLLSLRYELAATTATACCTPTSTLSVPSMHSYSASPPPVDDKQMPSMDSDSMSVFSGVTNYVDSILTATNATAGSGSIEAQKYEAPLFLNPALLASLLPQLQLQQPMYYGSPSPSPSLIQSSLESPAPVPLVAAPPAIQPMTLSVPVPRSKGRVSRTTAAAAATPKPESLIQYTLYNDPLELYHYACSPLGSAYISSKVANATYFPIFFEKLSKFFPLLMVNALGHAVCRALYSQPHCAMSHKLSLLRSLVPGFADIASNRQGSFALICIMSLMTSSAEIEVLAEAFLSCIDDEGEDAGENAKFDVILLSQSGYHVIKKYVAFGYPHFDCILHAISKDFTKYATHHYGVPIIRSTLDMLSGNPDLVAEYQHYLQLFAQHTHSLVSNQYGNYVMQQLLEISPPIITDTIKEFMSANYAEYAQHKFASNVVEKCLKHTLAAFREQLGSTRESCSPQSTEEKEEEHVTAGISGSSSISGSPRKPGSRKRSRRKRKKSGSKKENEMATQHAMVRAERDNHWIEIIIRELLCDAPNLINHKFGNYCLQTALSVLIELTQIKTLPDHKQNMLLLNDFVNTVYPLLDLLRTNVRKKWQQLLIAATKHDKTKKLYFHTYYTYYEDVRY